MSSRDEGLRALACAVLHQAVRDMNDAALSLRDRGAAVALGRGGRPRGECHPPGRRIDYGSA